MKKKKKRRKKERDAKKKVALADLLYRQNRIFLYTPYIT